VEMLHFVTISAAYFSCLVRAYILTGASVKRDRQDTLSKLCSMLQFAVGFVIYTKLPWREIKTKMGCRPSQKQNSAKKQVPSP